MLSSKSSTMPLLARLDRALVQDMNDGGMGSLRFWRKDGEGRRFGGMPVDAMSHDEDGTTVIASIYVDQTGSLYELDMWKVDFSPLKRLPPPSEVEIDPPALHK